MAPAYSFDVLIVGSGGAGLGLALQLLEGRFTDGDTVDVIVTDGFTTQLTANYTGGDGVVDPGAIPITSGVPITAKRPSSSR